MLMKVLKMRNSEKWPDLVELILEPGHLLTVLYVPRSQVGDTTPGSYLDLALSRSTKFDYFLDSLEKHHSDECLLWPFCKGAYYLTYGYWPKPYARHRCDTPACFNPRHVRPGTQSENLCEARDKGRLRPAFGEKHAFAKVTESQVRQIRREYERGHKGYVRLGKEFRLSPDAIKQIILRRNWKHVA